MSRRHRLMSQVAGVSRRYTAEIQDDAVPGLHTARTG